MRISLLPVLCLLCGALNASPVLQSVINSSVYHASSSATRCVTAFYDPTNLGTALNYLTLWNIENPQLPRAGTTIYEEQWNGWVAYRQPTVYQNYLLYMDNFHLHILDIDNVNSPVQASQFLLEQTYCFTVLDHYLIRGTQEGTLLVHDISDPYSPEAVDSITSMAAIWTMWPCENLLAVRCGNYSNNTAKLYQFISGTLTELASVSPGGQIDYCGVWNGKLVLQRADRSILLYDYVAGGETTLVAEIPASPQMNKIITDGTNLVSVSEDNCVRIWQWSTQSGLTQQGYFDLSHLDMQAGAPFQLKNGVLLFSVDNVLCLWLDISDPDPEFSLVSTYADGSDYRSIAIPPQGPNVFCERNNEIFSLKLDSAGQITPDTELSVTDAVIDLKNYRDNLYYLTQQNSSLHLKGMNVSNPANPQLFADVPIVSEEFFSIKEQVLYSGTYSHIDKYVLDSSGNPVWQKQLSYIYPDGYYQVGFYDIASCGAVDYAVGMFGSWMVGYYPILVYWLADGSVGYQLLGKFMDKVEIHGDYMYLLGWGIQVYQINSTRLPQFIGEHYATQLNYGVRSSLIMHNRYLIVNYLLSNGIFVYDLQNPGSPVQIDVIHQSTTSYELGYSGTKLVSGSGIYGISVYELPISVESSDLVAPAPLQLSAYPNPFMAQIKLSFDLDKAGPVSVECYNIRGQLVYSDKLAQAKAGTNTVLWKGFDNEGRTSPAGVYIIKLRTSTGSAIRKITKLK